MRCLTSRIVLALSFFGALSAANAANSDLTVTAVPIPTEVSVSRQCENLSCALTNVAAFEIAFQNNTPNVINQVVVSGARVQVTGSSPTQTSTFIESIPAGVCASPDTPASNQIQCNIGQLRGSTTVVVLFRSPPSGPGITYDSTPGASRIDFSFEGTFSNAASPTSPPAGGGVFSGSASANLITTESVAISRGLKTYIPSFGSSFFTGRNATAFDFDPSTTKLTIPAGLGLTTAEISEDDGVPGGLTNLTLTTNTTLITIPGRKNAQGSQQLFSSPVTVEIRRDSSTIRVFNQIDRAVLFYTSDAGEPVQLSSTQIQDCSVVNGPNSNFPVCVSQRIAVTKKTLAENPSLTEDDLGDWIFLLRALQNGRISW